MPSIFHSPFSWIKSQLLIIRSFSKSKCLWTSLKSWNSSANSLICSPRFSKISWRVIFPLINSSVRLSRDVYDRLPHKYTPNTTIQTKFLISQILGDQWSKDSSRSFLWFWGPNLLLKICLRLHTVSLVFSCSLNWSFLT